jgi:ubiquinol-cytochrome c reductase cytochrome b subunit
MRILKSHPLLKLVNHYLIDATQPSNISYLWNFGSLLAVCLVIQIATGVTLAMHYNPSVLEAFNSIEHIMRDVNNGWLIRYLHSNTASAFFFLVYLHIGRGFYYGSYRSPRTLVWVLGTVILIAMIGTGFLGYVLPYGQMSLWGATVITNLISAIPWIGQDIVEFIWGGFSVNNATLNRFFALHYLLPFVLAALVLMHLIALHDTAGSSNPLGISGNYDRVTFAPYFLFKDLITIFLFIFVLSIFVFFMPNVLGDSDNYIMANPMQTPAAIVPEWYLLPFYAILRSIPNKFLGVVTMFAALVIITILPVADLGRSKGLQFRPLSKIMFFIFVANFIILMQLGAKHVETPFIEFGQISTVLYFSYFLLFVPTISLIENTLVDLSIIQFRWNSDKNSNLLTFKRTFHSTSKLYAQPFDIEGLPKRTINGEPFYWKKDNNGNYNWMGRYEGWTYYDRSRGGWYVRYRYADLSPPTEEERRAAGILHFREPTSSSNLSTEEIVRNSKRDAFIANLKKQPNMCETLEFNIRKKNRDLDDGYHTTTEKATRQARDSYINHLEAIRKSDAKESSTQVRTETPLNKLKRFFDDNGRGGPGGSGPSGPFGSSSGDGGTSSGGNFRIIVQEKFVIFLKVIKNFLKELFNINHYL